VQKLLSIIAAIVVTTAHFYGISAEFITLLGNTRVVTMTRSAAELLSSEMEPNNSRL
jgi:hypothetical protein